MREIEICTWHEDNDGAWHTSCGICDYSLYKTPTEKGFKFCPYCGKALKEEKFEYEKEDV